MSVDVIKDMGHSVNARLKSLAGQRRVSFDYLPCVVAVNDISDSQVRSKGDI